MVVTSHKRHHIETVNFETAIVLDVLASFVQQFI